MTFNYYEPIKADLPSKIQINENNPENNIDESLLIRLFSGTINFNNIEMNQSMIKQRINYMMFTYKKNSRISPSILSTINVSFIDEDINGYLIRSRNKMFFKELVHELATAFYFKKNKSYTTSFIHIYRFIEQMSYPFPLFYASISNDFRNSFAELKTLFNDTSGNGALNFHKVFFNKLFEVNDLTIPYNNRITLDFTYLTSHEFDNIRKAFLEVIASNKKLPHSEFDFDNQKVIFKFHFMHDLIITFRNRFFHSLVTQNNNISATYFVSEVFFQTFNEYAFNWIAYVFGEIIDKRISKII